MIRDHIAQPEIEYNPLRVTGSLPNAVRQLLKRYRDGATAAQIAQLMARDATEVRTALHHLEDIGAAEQRGTTWHTFGALEPRRTTFVLANAPAWKPAQEEPPKPVTRATRKPPAPSGGSRRTTYDPELAGRYLDALRAGGRANPTARKLGLYQLILSSWRSMVPEFDAAVREALEASRLARIEARNAADPEGAKQRYWGRVSKARKKARGVG